ncbi:MAG: ABC transporter substrate-binding protein, partial [Clostridia bacterium]|nr:ABC transporter substrate-binding protein [Clostridia bacterium]
MMMKKNIRLFMLLMVLCLLFTGCHGRKEMAAFESPLQFDESRTYEITFWAKNDTNMTQMQIYKDAIAGFEQLYPNIKVKLVPYTDYGRIYQ